MPKESVVQKLRQHALDDVACRRELAIAIEGLAEPFLGQSVDHHIAGAGIEGGYILGRGLRRNRSEICNPADVEGNPPHMRMSIEQVVEIGNQRRTLAASSHVGGTEVRDHRNSGARCDNCGLAGLPCDCELFPQECRLRSLMIERLPVATDQLRFVPKLPLGGKNRIRVQPAEKKIQTGEICDARTVGIHQAEHHAANLRRIRKAGIAQELQSSTGSVADSDRGDIDHRHIDPIG